MTRYVITDDARWKVLAEVEIDGEPGYELERRVLVKKKEGDTTIYSHQRLQLVARERDCSPDNHEPVKVWRTDDAVVRFYPKRGIIRVSEPKRRPLAEFTMKGLLLMCARQKAIQRASDKAHKKRMRGVNRKK